MIELSADEVHALASAAMIVLGKEDVEWMSEYHVVRELAQRAEDASLMDEDHANGEGP